jgi:hypothetical protein
MIPFSLKGGKMQAFLCGSFISFKKKRKEKKRKEKKQL